VKNLPVLSKGKGNKIINIPSARAKVREEFVTLLAIVPDGASVTLHAGRRKLTLKPADIEHYRGERGRRGNKLPRGLQRVDQVEVELSKASLQCNIEQDSANNEEVKPTED
jgi:topoisomerase-4 subunit A